MSVLLHKQAVPLGLGALGMWLAHSSELQADLLVAGVVSRLQYTATDKHNQYV
jgi:hypothetical protein